MQSLRDDWRDYKRDAALLDCDDLLYTARNLLRDHEEEVRRALSQRFRHVMVDEFQDTDPLQKRSATRPDAAFEMQTEQRTRTAI
jgi:ATP-dependent exoDNAse (exonuclease V) beta subunit